MLRRSKRKWHEVHFILSGHPVRVTRTLLGSQSANEVMALEGPFNPNCEDCFILTFNSFQLFRGHARTWPNKMGGALPPILFFKEMARGDLDLNLASGDEENKLEFHLFSSPHPPSQFFLLRPLFLT